MSSQNARTKQDEIRDAVLRIEDKREMIGRLLSEIDNDHDVIDSILESFTPPF